MLDRELFSLQTLLDSIINMSDVQDLIESGDLPGAVTYVQALQGKAQSVQQVVSSEVQDDDVYVAALLLSIKRPKVTARKLSFRGKTLASYHRLFLFR